MTRRKKAIYWLGGTAVALLSVGWCVRLAMNKPKPFPFLEHADVVRQEEWMEGPRLKTGGNYMLNGSIGDVQHLVSESLHEPDWTVAARPIFPPLSIRTPVPAGSKPAYVASITYSNKDRYVTLLDHPVDHRVKIIIQEYSDPTFLDRARLWTNRFWPHR